MIEPSALAHLSPAKRAEVIYAQARSEVNAKLWQMALGSSEEERSQPAGLFNGGPNRGGLDSLLALLVGKQQDQALPLPQTEQLVEAREAQVVPAGYAAEPVEASSITKDFGRNGRFQPMIEGAAHRAGMPPSALAAIIDAEAGKLRAGEWNPFSRNPRSSAAGLGQFLSGTWISEAQRPGNWLNAVASERGWLDSRGRVLPSARHQLLALRYDPQASIEATADYARNNLRHLERSGIKIGASAAAVSHVAYIAHHLGVGDAVRFMRNGIPEDRARELLSAQIGSARAAQRIDQAGSAKVAHREWLNGFVSNRVRPGRFDGAA